jgi:hypothetical protein
MLPTCPKKHSRRSGGYLRRSTAHFSERQRSPLSGSARVAGLDVVSDAGKLRERIGLAGQYAAVDENLTASRTSKCSAASITSVAVLLGPGRACWPVALGRDRSAGRGRHHLPPDDAVPRRGRPPSSSDRGDRPRPLDRRGDAGRAQGQVGGNRLEVRLEDPSQCEPALSALRPPADGSAVLEDGLLRVPLSDRRGAIAQAVRELDAAAIGIDDLAVRRPSTTSSSSSLGTWRRRRRARNDRARARAGGHARPGQAKLPPHPAPARSARRLHGAAGHVCPALRLRPGRRHPDTGLRLRRLPDARDHRPVDGLRWVRDGARALGGPEEGADRPLPVSAHVTRGRADRPDASRRGDERRAARGHPRRRPGRPGFGSRPASSRWSPASRACS